MNLKKKFKGKIVFEFNKLLSNFNLQISPLGRGFRQAKEMVQAARLSGVSLNEYLESLATDSRNLGQRDRVVGRILSYIPNKLDVIEIGSGSMRYSDALVSHTDCRSYQIYETQKDWRDFAKKNPRFQNTSLVVHTPNGKNLSESESGSVDLIHAHGVFVYLTFLESVEYLKDAARVLKSGGFLIFDIFDIQNLSRNSIEGWFRTPHRWPTFLSIPILVGFLSEHNLVQIDQFEEFYGASQVTYLVMKKV